MANDNESKHVTLRMSRALLDKIDAASDHLGRTELTNPSGSTSRSEAIRRLVVMGLESVDETD